MGVCLAEHECTDDCLSNTQPNARANTGAGCGFAGRFDAFVEAELDGLLSALQTDTGAAASDAVRVAAAAMVATLRTRLIADWSVLAERVEKLVTVGTDHDESAVGAHSGEQPIRMPQASEAVILAGGCAADDCGCCGAVELDVDFRAVADSVFDGNSKLKQLSNGVCPLDLILCHRVAAKSLPFFSGAYPYTELQMARLVLSDEVTVLLASCFRRATHLTVQHAYESSPWSPMS
jgi:hypothetical protein